jgi:riboflavin synthase
LVAVWIQRLGAGTRDSRCIVFTGLIQDCGTVETAEPTGHGGVSIAIRTRLAPQLALGDSLAVDGVCLTVERKAAELVYATAVSETLSRTTLGGLRRGERVHLEPALRAGDPLGGHVVQGHVDGIGRVVENGERGQGWVLSVDVPAEVSRYVVHKGSIALAGVSLTVAALDDSKLSVALVPHTLSQTLFTERRVGASVNIEVDILAKYVERMLSRDGERGRVAPQPPLTELALRQMGYSK